MLTHQELTHDIETTRLEPGSVAFWWLGQLSYVVKVGDLVLYFDPFLAPLPQRNIPPLLAPSEITHADWVFGSHDHADHIDPYALDGICKASPKARFVCSRVAKAHLLEIGIPEERIVALDGNLCHVEPDLRITAIPAQHEFFDRDPVLGYPYLSYVVETQGITVHHAGDTLRYDGLIARLREWSFDIMFVPINGRDAERLARNCIGNMTYQEAVDLVGELKPRLAVPGHYEMFDGNTEDPQKFARYMDVKFPDVAYWLGEHGTRVTLPPA